MRWFISDSHFQHTNIIRYCDRPFKDTLEMDITMMDLWNERVKEGDIVYHLGDFSFKPWIWRPTLNGHIILIQGNHDKRKDTRCFEYRKNLVIQLGPFRCYLTHRPSKILPQELQLADFILHGHIHNTYLYSGKFVNLGVDVWNFKPVSEVELIKFLKEIK